jgi:hypothetical protein
VSRRRRQIAEALVARAGVQARVESVVLLDIGKAGINSRPSREDDTAFARIHLDDGSTVIMRDYSPTARNPSQQQARETAVLRSLRDSGLPVPEILASVAGDRAATLLADHGGEPLEGVLRSVPKSSRSALWSSVGSALRDWHGADPTVARFAEMGTRAWKDFIPYFVTKLKAVAELRPDLAPAVDAFLALRQPLKRYLDGRPRAISVTGAMGGIPGALVRRDGRAWSVTSWLILGFDVVIKDPARDVVAISVSHREWTGDALPTSFWRSYGSRPDPICELVYEANLLVDLGARYQRGSLRAHPRAYDFPLPHSTAIDALERFPETVLRLESLLDALPRMELAAR